MSTPTTPEPGVPEPVADTPHIPQEDPMPTTEPTTPIPEPATPIPGSTTPIPEPATPFTESATTPTSAPPTSAPAPGVRVGSTVWGLVVLAIGLGLIALAAGAVFDVQLAVIGLVAAAGVALLVGSLLTAGGRRR